MASKLLQSLRIKEILDGDNRAKLMHSVDSDNIPK